MSNLISSWKDKGFKPDDLNQSDSDFFANGKAINIYKIYQSRLVTLNSADFGDLLLYNLTIFTNHLDILQKYQSKILYFLVDEYKISLFIEKQVLFNLILFFGCNACSIFFDTIIPTLELLLYSESK